MKKVFKIQGMKCVSCSKIIEMSLKEEAGVDSAGVNFITQKAFLEFNPDQIDAPRIKNIIKGLGYTAIEE